MDTTDIREALEIMDAAGLTEITVESGSILVSLKREAASLPADGAYSGGFAIDGDTVEPPSANSIGASEAIIKAGMVGILRLTDRHGGLLSAEGAHVSKGQVVCIIEAMKIGHEVRSEFDGVVAGILIGDGMPVEYGEPLIIIHKEE